MYIYNYRIFDRYKKEVISLAILTDSSPGFRPKRYETSRWGFVHIFDFPMVKLIDYKDRWAEMEKSKNPFALIVMAHLKEMETKGDIDKRLFWKITLVKRLYEKGFSKRDILLLYKFIDWLISLPDEVNKKFHGEITRFEEVKKMPYITTAERIGIEKGMQRGIQDGVVELLEIRFKAVPMSLIKKIKSIEEVKVLSSLHREAILANSLEQFKQVMNKMLG